MRAWIHYGLLVVLSGALTTVALGQSVADAARQEQARKTASPPARHVYTNDDLSAGAPDAAPVSGQEGDSKAGEVKSAAADGTKKPTAEELRTKILAQKRKVQGLEDHIADLQRRLDEWNNDSGANLKIFPGAGHCGQYYNNPYEDWCNIPAKLQADYKKSKAQLDDAQHLLEQMQEETRKLGYRSAVYDPD